MADSSNDLPLVSNVKDMLVKHYMFNFSCSFEERIFTCTMLIFLEPVTSKTERIQCICSQNNFQETKKDSISSLVSLNEEENNSKENFKLILDCHKILVHNVEEISFAGAEKNIMYKGCNPSAFSVTKKLNFSTDKWSLRIWSDSCFCKFCFPPFIRISYQTIPEGSSLLWVTDQDKK